MWSMQGPPQSRKFPVVTGTCVSLRGHAKRRLTRQCRKERRGQRCGRVPNALPDLKLNKLWEQKGQCCRHKVTAWTVGDKCKRPKSAEIQAVPSSRTGKGGHPQEHSWHGASENCVLKRPANVGCGYYATFASSPRKGFARPSGIAAEDRWTLTDIGTRGPKCASNPLASGD